MSPELNTLIDRFEAHKLLTSSSSTSVMEALNNMNYQDRLHALRQVEAQSRKSTGSLPEVFLDGFAEHLGYESQTGHAREAAAEAAVVHYTGGGTRPARR